MLEVDLDKMRVSNTPTADDDESIAVTSPCISICFLDESDVCLGCYRSAQEITDWSVFTHRERKAAMDNVKKRHRAMNKHLLL